MEQLSVGRAGCELPCSLQVLAPLSMHWRQTSMPSAQAQQVFQHRNRKQNDPKGLVHHSLREHAKTGSMAQKV